MDINLRIRDIRNLLGESKTSFARELNIDNSQYGKIESGKLTPTIAFLLELFSKYKNINPEWIMTGNGSMLKEEAKPAIEVVPLNAGISKNISEQEVPLFDVSASAGIQSIFLNPNQLIPLEYIKIPNLPKVDGAIRITGDSMYPLLKSGDIIIYKEGYDKDFIVWGEIYLVYVQNAEGEECFAVKYLKKSERNGYIRLVSYNDHHAPQEYPIEYLKKWALVKASIRINSAI